MVLETFYNTPATRMLEEYPLSAVRDCLFNMSLFTAALCSILTLRTRRNIFTVTHLAWIWFY